jgi:diacylglycerol kinase
MKTFLKGFVYAFNGIVIALKSERNMKVHVLAVVVVSAAGFYYHIAAIEWIALLLCFSMVISLEMINTAIEILANKISPEKNQFIGNAKDIAAGSVLVAAIFSVGVAFLVFGQYVF